MHLHFFITVLEVKVHKVNFNIFQNYLFFLYIYIWIEVAGAPRTTCRRFSPGAYGGLYVAQCLVQAATTKLDKISKRNA